MKKRILFLILFCGFFIPSYGQFDSLRFRKIRYDFSLGMSRQSTNLALSGSYFVSLDRNQQFLLGGGVRTNFLVVRGATYKVQGTETEFGTAEGYVVNLNLFASAEVRLLKRFGLGANIDIIGGSLGRLGVSTSQTVVYETEVPGFNLLVGPNKDKGALNSEFYIYFLDSNLLQIRAGFAHLFSQVRVSLAGTNTLCDSYENVGFVATRFCF